MSDAPDRPHVIVHMASSLDGRVQTSRWAEIPGELGYEAVHQALGGTAWMCGRLTMRGYTRGSPADDTDPTPVPRTDHLAKPDAVSFAVALDFSGRLHWGWRNDIDGDHVVVIVGEGVPDEHLNGLRDSGVSYLFGGRDRLDLPRARGKLKRLLGVARGQVAGGGGINGAGRKAGCVDEVSLLRVPTVDGGRGVPALFDYDVAGGDEPAGKGVALTLTACEPQSNGVIRLRYAVAPVRAGRDAGPVSSAPPPPAA